MSAADEVLKAEKDWGQAIAANDAKAIGKFTAEDWIIVGADGIIDRARFLGVVQSGTLTHDRMDASDMQVRVYGDTVVLTGVVLSAGKWMGQAFAQHERFTDVWVKQHGEWRCVLTHLTKIAKK